MRICNFRKAFKFLWMIHANTMETDGSHLYLIPYRTCSHGRLLLGPQDFIVVTYENFENLTNL